MTFAMAGTIKFKSAEKWTSLLCQPMSSHQTSDRCNHYEAKVTMTSHLDAQIIGTWYSLWLSNWITAI